MNLNKLNNFLNLCESSPTTDRVVAIYEDFFSPTGLYIEHTARNNTIRLRYVTTNYNNVSSEYSLFTFSAKDLAEALEELSEDTMSKIIDWKSGYSTIALDIALNAINSCLSELEDLGHCSIDESDRKDELKVIRRNADTLLTHILKILRFTDKESGQHHNDDINTWLRQTTLAVNDFSFKMDKDLLKDLLYYSLIKSHAQAIDNRIKTLERPENYGKLTRYLSVERIKEILPFIYDKLADSMLSGEFLPKIFEILSEVDPSIVIEHYEPNPEGSRKKSRKSKRSK